MVDRLSFRPAAPSSPHGGHLRMIPHFSTRKKQSMLIFSPATVSRQWSGDVTRTHSHTAQGPGPLCYVLQPEERLKMKYYFGKTHNSGMRRFGVTVLVLPLAFTPSRSPLSFWITVNYCMVSFTDGNDVTLRLAALVCECVLHPRNSTISLLFLATSCDVYARKSVAEERRSESEARCFTGSSGMVVLVWPHRTRTVYERKPNFILCLHVSLAVFLWCGDTGLL